MARARQAQGLSTRQVADRLHIIPRYVEALEKSQFDLLPGEVFIKGYVRAYAELLKLDPAPLLGQLSTELAAAASPRTESSMPVRKRNGGWIVFVLIVVAAIGYAFWQAEQGSRSEDLAEIQQQGRQDVEQGEEAASGQAPGGAVMSSDSKASTPGEGDQTAAGNPGGETGAPVAAETSRSATPPVPEKDNALSSGQATGAAGETDIVQETAALQSDSVDEGGVPADQAIGETGDGTAVSSGMADILQAEMVATFSDRCWFDARSADGQREVGLFKAGDVVRLKGAFPLSFIIGNVDAVSLRVNGIPVGFDRFRVRNKRVEFKLSAEDLVSQE
ncbi:RodZ domain-containing protein [Hahella sp. SMD15-11]|uniref:RodZ domain-containing protein n=1 Tax=Thermohahella caldifontis TaxID=3142973 RepID=A0AB39UZC8_9GAMM